MIKAVIDTNVLVSGLLKGRNARSIINAFSNNKFHLIVADELINELIFTLRKPRLKNLIPESDITMLLALINDRAWFIKIHHNVTVCRDVKDNIFLACTHAGHADFLVSGDDDLLVLKNFERTAILTPTVFLKLLNT